jgi:hypothetical protein
MKKIGLILSLVSAILLSCNESKQKGVNETNISNTKNDDFELIGKKGILNYPDFTAYVTYSTDSTLHWKTVDKDGKQVEGDEEISYKKLSDSLFFLNWIEKDGFTVSQVIDTKSGTVKAYLSYSDDKSERGKRSSSFADATFKFDK